MKHEAHTGEITKEHAETMILSIKTKHRGQQTQYRFQRHYISKQIIRL